LPAREHVFSKIPATPQSIVACQSLEKISIHTLATSQAVYLYIALYFDGIFDSTVYID
jgi:hypothetical protein